MTLAPLSAGPNHAIRVWDLPQRLTHWLLAAAAVTAYLSANVLDDVHVAAGYAAGGLVAFRVVWGFVGSSYARFASFVKPPTAVWRYLRGLRTREPGAYVGLNPAGAAMALALWLGIAVTAISGWLQLTERFFGLAWIEAVHTRAANLVMVLAGLHVGSVLLTSWLQRENLVWAMITGKKRSR